MTVRSSRLEHRENRSKVVIMSNPERPLYIQLHPRDNVAIIVNDGGLPAGTQFASGLSLTEAVPEAHKVALAEILPGQPIVRYGMTIGYAAAPIAKGSCVREEAVRLPSPPDLNRLPICTATPEPLPPLDGYTFDGFVNADGSVGPKIFSALPQRFNV